MPKQKPYDPLDCIPSVEIIEQRLKDAESKARKLRVLLRTARKIERQTDSSPPMKEAADE
jgi:hypothetical protein